MGKLCRKVPYGPGAEELVNRGRKYLNYVERMPDFLGSPVLDEVYKTTLARRTLILAGGVVLKTTRGPINRSEAFVPTPTQAVRFRGGYFIGVDVWDMAETEIIGVYVSDAEKLDEWSFIPSPGVAWPIAQRAADRDGLAYGATIGSYVEIVPNLITADRATLASVVEPYSLDEQIFPTYGVYPADNSRPLPAMMHPWAGEPYCGNSWGGWYVLTASECWRNPPAWYSAGKNILGLGSATGTKFFRNPRTRKVTIHGNIKIVGTYESGYDGTYNYPVGTLSNEWIYGAWADINYSVGLHSNSWTNATSIDGVAFNMLNCPKCVINNTWRSRLAPTGVYTDDVSGLSLPYQMQVEVLFQDKSYVLEESTVTGVSATDKVYEFQSTPKYYNATKEEIYLCSYTDREYAAPRKLTNACVNIIIGGVSNTKRFPGSVGSSGAFAQVDLGKSGSGLVDTSRVRLLTKV